jgi:hypothetical protein
VSDYTFTIDGTPLTGTDGFGCEWHCEVADGWLTGAAVRVDVQARMQQDGDWRGRGFRGGRSIVLRGTVVCPDEVATDAAARRLGAVLADGTFGTLEGVGPLVTATTQVQLNDTPAFELLTERVAAWQLALASAEPHLYGGALFYSTNLGSTAGGTGLPYPLAYPLSYGVAAGVLPGTLFLPNTGTVSYQPRLRIDGPVTNPIVTLAETGDWVRYGGAIPAGSWLDIDAATRNVMLNGSVSHEYLVTYSGAWLAVPVGGGSVTWTADTADAAALLSVWAYEGAWS